MTGIRREMIMLSGLNCPTCAAKLEKAVQATPGVTEAKVVFGAGSLNVEYDLRSRPTRRSPMSYRRWA